MAKPNYQYEKRQKELQKKRKLEEKRLRKLEKSAAQQKDSRDKATEPGDTVAKDE